jgi:hypothetical protein
MVVGGLAEIINNFSIVKLFYVFGFFVLFFWHKHGGFFLGI